MREHMRHSDRALSNLEAIPGGFNHLRRMYETIQEPLMNAATQGGAGGDAPDSSNPLAALFQGMGGQQQQQGGQGAVGAPAASTPENAAPMPNPWAPNQAAAGAVTAVCRAGQAGRSSSEIPCELDW